MGDAFRRVAPFGSDFDELPSALRLRLEESLRVEDRMLGRIQESAA